MAATGALETTVVTKVPAKAEAAVGTEDITGAGPAATEETEVALSRSVINPLRRFIAA